MAKRKASITVEYALIGLLRQQPMHGYELHQQLVQRTNLGSVWHVKQSMLYAILSRLEDEELVEADVEEQGPRPPRRRLHVTPRGEAAFRAWIERPVESGRSFRLEFLAKLYFAQQESSAAVVRLVECQRAVLADQVAELGRSLDALTTDAGFDRLVLLFRVGQLEAMLAWLEECRRSYVSPPPARTIQNDLG